METTQKKVLKIDSFIKLQIEQCFEDGTETTAVNIIGNKLFSINLHNLKSRSKKFLVDMEQYRVLNYLLRSLG